jgi:hypothetical protein
VVRFTAKFDDARSFLRWQIGRAVCSLLGAKALTPHTASAPRDGYPYLVTCGDDALVNPVLLCVH